MFETLGRFNYRRRRLVLALTGVFVVAAIAWGTGVFGSLANGGFEAPDTEAYRAVRTIEQTVGRTGTDVIVLYRSDSRTVADPAVRQTVESHLSGLPTDEVLRTTTFWSTRSPAFVSKDQHSTYAVLTLAGADPEERLATFHKIADQVRQAPAGLDVKVGGEVAVFDEVNTQTEHDIVQAETISLPIVLVLLVVVFGGLVAASLPLFVGGLAILGAFVVLRVLTTFTDVSVFSINIVTMIGLGLAIDYALFIVTRFREQLALGNDVETALTVTMGTAGRTVAFSGVTVGVAIASLVLFPVMFLRSMAYGGAAAVLVAMIAALTALPALLAVLGHRVNNLRLPFLKRGGGLGSTEHGAWYKLAQSVMKRPIRYVVVLVPLLLVLGIPFLQAQLGGVDHRALPAGADSRTVTETLQSAFAGAGGSDVLVAARLSAADPAATLAPYIAELERVPGVESVRLGGYEDGVASVVVHTHYTSQELPAREVVKGVRAVTPPAGTSVEAGGDTAALVDLLHVLGQRVPWMAGFIVLVTFALLFVAFGSIVLPAKALLMNVLSLSASFGAMVWIFQDGNLSGLLDFTPAGFLDATNPVLLFAVLFGLSMDYEVFLLSRIREEYDRTGDNTRAVALGLQRTGGIITSAALLLIIVVGAFATSGIVFVKMIGIGLVIAIAIDATVVRALLVPATMRLLGRANWWAPAPLARWWQRHGFRESGPVQEQQPEHELTQV
ncbi:RND superfamily putative drug exporter [Kribbella orskensis]|uniref:RND superfamily putative drug exporter n=1 Tax=Kribbella orskensis TaxID=2512216 RepID=A0ABY2B7X3_9ACTN|nr:MULTISPECIES: MMPL family transporter [Kribbella]TCN29984.1 RND superfamily putative drug exporter [Kribbella sp. VKM Ac-2500]TCO10104.1 RND superfamily putative drug exporter [Kribbella orskensis]